MGTIQGEDNSPPTVYTFATHEQANYYTVSEYISDGALISVNADWWNGLTAEEQDKIRKCFDRAGDFVHDFQTDQFNEAIEAFEESGVDVNFLTAEQKEPFRELLQPIYTQMSEIVGEEDFEQLLQAVDKARER
jgi:TRAP-type C4-dicarboxylate transport system substrate-binding protein